MTDWEAVVRDNVAAVQNTAYRLVGNHADAWDCVQETFLEAVKLERRESVRDWPALLRRVATSRALDLLRARARQRQRFSSEADPAMASGREAEPPRQAEANELAGRLRAALRRLPGGQAEVFCLFSFEQLSCEEAAQQLGVSPSAARMLLSRARRRLQRLLGLSCGSAAKDRVKGDKGLQ
jgi:RNA polymerase sigma-70 factor (ECF subfamily)